MAGEPHEKKERRTVVYDGMLRVEAYRFQGIKRPFPNHFHGYYVIGLVEDGERRLCCKNREHSIKKGDILLFNPGDSHACTQSGCGALDYRGFNISKEVMLDLIGEATGKRALPGFSQSVIQDEETARLFRSLHEQTMKSSGGFGREEGLVLLLSRLFQRYGQPFERCVPECREEIERACAFMEEHYAQHVDLEEICRLTGLSKPTLLRAFTKSRGVTPYSYLVNIRIGEARKLLEQGVPLAEAALRTGFFDQSHFANCFQRLIGLPPGVYRSIFSEQGEDPHGT